MENLVVEYSTIKTIIGKQSYYQQVSSGYNIFVISLEYIAQCKITSPSDVADFEANYIWKCSETASRDDALVTGLQELKSSRTSDGRQIVLPSTIGEDEDVQYVGSGDDITNGVRLGGTDMKYTTSVSGDGTVEFQFMDYVDIAGGLMLWTGGMFGDYFHYDCYAPATAGDSNPGAGAYDKYSIGPDMNMYIPNATNEGDWDLDLEETYNANVSFKKVVPVPIRRGMQGWFDWDYLTEAVTLNPYGNGGYNLFDFDLPLTRFIHKSWLLGSGSTEYIVPASYGAKTLLAQWKHKVTIHRAGLLGTLDCCWWLFFGRQTTTPG